MEVKQQHVSYETGDEPRCRLNDSLESGCHEQSIPHCLPVSGAEL